ncbi:MAG: RT0821/Lpp0805 family surface protein [Pseudomonadota bacterium]
MKTKRSFATIGALVAVTIGLAACNATNAGEKQTFGTLLGAGLGGLAGAQIGSGSGQLAATAAGVLLGGFLGNEVGASLDRADKAYMQQTAARTLETAPTGSSVPWRNPDSGNSGTVTVDRTFERDSGQFCREYRHTVEIGGQTEVMTGVACRQADGTWSDA